MKNAEYIKHKENIDNIKITFIYTGGCIYD